MIYLTEDDVEYSVARWDIIAHRSPYIIDKCIESKCNFFTSNYIQSIIEEINYDQFWTGLNYTTRVAVRKSKVQI